MYEVLENKKIKDIDEEEIKKIDKDCEKLKDINFLLFELIFKKNYMKRIYQYIFLHLNQKMIM